MQTNKYRHVFVKTDKIDLIIQSVTSISSLADSLSLTASSYFLGLLISFTWEIISENSSSCDKLYSVECESKQIFAINLFQKEYPLLVRTSTIEKVVERRSETKNIKFFCYDVYFAFQQIDNGQQILRKIHFHMKAIKHWTIYPCSQHKGFF